jgi:F420-non-reducing hydrogenase small subunit
MGDLSIDVTLFNGAIRTSENVEMAHLLRRKSRVLVAYGACSAEGGIPALSNLHTRENHLRDIYLDNPSTENGAGVLPQSRTLVPEGELELPEFLDRVGKLSDVVPVDYVLPGCPPESDSLWRVLETLMQGMALPPPGSVLGESRSTVCRTCTRRKENKSIERFYRTYETITDPERCLLEQGLVCMGIATRDGCGALCPKVNMPCSGCYGAPDGIADQGAGMISALGSVLNIGAYKGMTEEQLVENTERVIAGIPDPAGGWYKYSLAGSELKAKRAE